MLNNVGNDGPSNDGVLALEILHERGLGESGSHHSIENDLIELATGALGVGSSGLVVVTVPGVVAIAVAACRGGGIVIRAERVELFTDVDASFSHIAFLDVAVGANAELESGSLISIEATSDSD